MIIVKNNSHAIRLISYRTLAIALSIFFLNRFSIDYFYGNQTLNSIYVLISEILTLYYVLLFFTHYHIKGNMYLSDVGCLFVTAIYLLYMLAITFFLGGNIRRVLMIAYPIVGTLCMVDVESDLHYKELISGMNLFFFIMVLWNFFDMIFIKKIFLAHVSTFFLGGRNQIALVLSIAFALYIAYEDIIYEDYSSHNFSKFFYLIIIFATALLSASATSLVGITFILVVYIVKFIKNRDVKINPIIVLLGYAVVWLSLIVFRLQYLFAKLIINVLHKDLTLSHRTIIWDRALEMIRKKWLFGYGMSNSVNVFTVHHDYTGGNNDVLTALSGHNEILQILYYGGIILLGIFIFLFYISCSKAKRENNIFYPYFLSVIVILIVWLSETPGEYGMFLMLGMCYYSNRYQEFETE